MAMSLPITIHSPPSSSNSPASDESSNPRTPLSPSNIKTPDNGNNPVPQQNSIGVTQMKRKPSRRANTAERRATHNAVERQRRETLNGRFLDLAALLPNLSQIRRPSKSAIVNSSIAHIHASRRHRLLASRELKQLKVESDAQRRELNEWRDRAGLPRVEEPVRGEGFTMVLNGEVEVLTAIINEDDEDGADGYDGYEDGDEYGGGIPSAPMTADNSEDIRLSQHAAAQLIKNSNTFGHNMTPSIPSNGSSNPNGMHIGHLLPRATQGGPIIAPNPSAVSFENPAMSSLYEPAQGPFSGAQFLQQGMAQTDDKVAAWNAQLYSVLANSGPHQQLQQLQAQRSLFTPPASAHGLSNGPSSAPATAFNDNQAFFANFQRQQLVAMQHSNMGHMYSSPDGDDSSSVGSAGGRRRERSGSLNSGSGYGSPQNGSPMGNYEMAGAGPEAQSEYGMPKRFNAGLQINTGIGSHWDSSIDGMNGLMKQNITPPISIGGGGNGNGFAMMMMM
jgi:hypothetical protein